MPDGGEYVLHTLLDRRITWPNPQRPEANLHRFRPPRVENGTRVYASRRIGPIARQQGGAWQADWLTACRPAHWVKNTLVLIPACASHQFTVDAWFAAAVAGGGFCLCASGIYLLNDILDRTTDRLSPTKAKRPIAAGRIHPPTALAGALTLVATGLAVAGAVSAFTCAWLATYAAVAVGYSLWWKRQPMLDVALLAGLHELRILTGAAAVGLSSISAALFTTTLFAFLALACAKRLGQIRLSEQHGRSEVAGLGWTLRDAPLALALAGASAVGSILTAILYANSPTALADLYETGSAVARGSGNGDRVRTCAVGRESGENGRGSGHLRLDGSDELGGDGHSCSVL